MAFDIEISEEEQAYLDNLPLSPTAKSLVAEFIEQTIANLPDQFRLDPARRLGPDSTHFRIRHLLHDF